MLLGELNSPMMYFRGYIYISVLLLMNVNMAMHLVVSASAS